MIPLEQGSVFRHIRDNTSEWASQSQSLWNRAVSSDLMDELAKIASQCLNPFGTGQCLPTNRMDYQ